MRLQTPLTTLEFAAEAVTSGVAGLATALCLSNGAAARATRWLGAFFACLGLNSATGASYLGWSAWLPGSAIAVLQVANVATAYLTAPLLYAYVTASLEEGRGAIWRPSGWHLLPALSASAYMTAWNVFPDLAASAFGRAGVYGIVYAWSVIGVPYLVLAAWRLRAAGRQAEDVSADETSLRLGWLRRSVTIVAALWLIVGLERLGAIRNERELAGTFADLCTAASVFLLAWSGLRSGALLMRRPIVDAPTPVPYARSGLGERDLAQIATDLARLMREKKLYADETLDLRALSEHSGDATKAPSRLPIIPS